MTIQHSRPILSIPLSPLEVLIEITAVAGIVFILFITIRYWSVLPARVPIHFNFSGKPDRWGHKYFLLVLFPAFAILLYIGLTILQRLSHTANYPFALTEENVQRQYQIARANTVLMKSELVWLLGLLEWQAGRVALGKVPALGIRTVLAMIAVIFTTSGIGLYQAYLAR